LLNVETLPGSWFFGLLMAMKGTSTYENGILVVVETGEFSMEEAQKTFLEMVEMVKQNGATKVLFDGRDITGEPELIERFYYGEFAAATIENLIRNGWTGRMPQFAYVLQEPVLDPLRLGETVAINRGMNVKAFNNTHEARQWLNADSAA